jgi:hypothetical protein
MDLSEKKICGRRKVLCWKSGRMTERLEDTDFYKKLQAYNERWEKEEEEKRQDIELKQKTDYFRRIDPMAKEWIKRYLSLSGVMRNQYNQIVDTCKRLSAMQISHILKEVHNHDVSPEMVGKYKQFLIKEGLLRTDKEIEDQRPSEEQLKQIQRIGARSQAIEQSKEKTHLDKEELREILERDKPKETKKDRIEELREKQERGLCLTDSEEQELEESEEKEEEENG